MNTLSTGQKILLAVLLFNPVAVALLAWAMWPPPRPILYALAGVALFDMLLAGALFYFFFKRAT
jgi:hypothetical protein